MSLPILPTRNEPTTNDLVRFFHRCELHWSRHLSEEFTLDVGTALFNPKLAAMVDANRVMDFLLPEGMSPSEAVAQVDAFFNKVNARCLRFVLAPSAPEPSVAPLRDYLLSKKYAPKGCDVYYLKGHPQGAMREVGGLTIIPARASFKHARQLALERAPQSDPKMVAESAMLHLDDSHCDTLLVLKAGQPIAQLAVLSVGEIGCIADLYVAPEFRRLGIGRTLMSRAMEICARSLFKHVLVGVDRNYEPAVALYAQFGFQRVGEFIGYAPPDVQG